ncbi:hypothetical protein Tco_1201091 [Tanacetum coccineum]
MGLWYSKDSCIALTTFADADHPGCQDTRRSTSGSMQLLGDRLVNWLSKKQKSTSILSIEAKYITLTMNPTTAQQVALDNALVSLVNQVNIGICNMRIDPSKTPKEPLIKLSWTLLHSLHAIKLS